MRIAILGNGPRLELPLDLYSGYDKVFITNRLLWESPGDLGLQNKIVYVCADRRFYYSAQWQKRLNEFKHTAVLSPVLFNAIKEEINSNNIKCFDDLPRQHLAAKVIELFEKPTDLLANVVLDFALPLAVNYDAKEIDLYGCSFDYQVSQDNLEPKYFSKYKSRGAAFDHTVKTAKDWSLSSQHKFAILKSFLEIHGICLRIHN